MADAMKKSRNPAAVVLIRLAIIAGAAVLYLHGLMTPTKPDAA